MWFLRPRDPPFVFLKNVSRRREKKERLRCDNYEFHRGVTSGLTSETHEVSRYAFCNFYEALGTPDFGPACVMFSPCSLCSLCPLCEPCFSKQAQKCIAPSRKEGVLTPRCSRGLSRGNQRADFGSPRSLAIRPKGILFRDSFIRQPSPVGLSNESRSTARR